MDKSEIHAGYEFEDGMFARMRCWVDVAPWIRLARVARILASPIHIALVAISWMITVLVFGYWFGTALEPPTLTYWSSDLALIFQTVISGGWGRALLFVGLAGMLWVPVIQFVGRSGAALTAGHSLPSSGAVLPICKSRLWMSFLVPIVPWACVLVFAAMLFLIRIPSLVIGASWVSIVSGWIIGLCSIPIGVLGFGAFFAIPLGIIAMVCEPDPDPIDSLSRGYEFLMRRPLSLVWYSLVSLLLIVIAGVFFAGVAAVSFKVLLEVSSLFSFDQVQADSAATVIILIVTSWKLTFAFGLLGGVYLLLRKDACGQDVEELWTPASPPSVDLPNLPDEAYQS